MGGKKASGENSKKTAGNAKKEEAAAQKKAAENSRKAVLEDEEWGKGAKNTAKKEAEAAKKAEQARKKAEKDVLLAEEEKDAPSAPKNKKTAVKKTTKSLDLSQLDNDGSNTKAPGALNATGIDNALDAFAITNNTSQKVEKHPERRYPAALAAYTKRRMAEMDDDGSGKGLRRDQKLQRIREEFKRSPDNPFNQVTANYDATKDELKELMEQEKSKIEARLGEKSL